MKIQVEIVGVKATMKVNGRFDFSREGSFHVAYESLLRQKELQVLEIDMSDVGFFDSSSLGMLLQLRERAHEEGKVVHLVKPSRTAAQSLEVANFDRLFSIAW